MLCYWLTPTPIVLPLLGIRGSASGTDRMFSAECPDRFWDPCSLLFSENRDSSGVKRPGDEVAHSPSSTVEIENGRFTCNTRICLHGLDGRNFTFYNLFVPSSYNCLKRVLLKSLRLKKERKVMSLEKVELLDKSHRQWDLLRSKAIMMSRNWWFFSSENEDKERRSFEEGESSGTTVSFAHLYEPSHEGTTWALCVWLWDGTREVSVVLWLGRGRAVMRPLSRVWGEEKGRFHVSGGWFEDFNLLVPELFF